MALHLIPQIISILAAIAATYFWFLSSKIKIPTLSIRSTQPLRKKGEMVFTLKIPMPSITDWKKSLEEYTKEQLTGDNELGNIAIGADFADEMKDLINGLIQQSKLSAYGAILTAISLLFQVVALIIS